MTMHEIIVLRRAVEALNKARRWYRRRNPRAAENLVQRVDEALLKISRDPYLSQVWDSEHRYERVSRYPYLIFFRIELQTLFVVAIVHERRRPEQWKRARKP
jgi:toxin ParE1/3/4